MHTTVLNITEIGKASDIIKKGGLVAFPTETVYGLGANALDPVAVQKIFVAKGRHADNPLIVHIADQNDIVHYAKNIPELVYTFIKAFWPGPLTLVLEKKDIIPDITTAGLNTVCLRMPSHPVALELIRSAGVPIAAPSANTSGRPSPTAYEHVLDDLEGKIEGVIKGEITEIGIESTVLDLTTSLPTLLRHGGVTKEMLEKYTVVSEKVDGKVAKSPGMKYRHYAPNLDIQIVDKNEFINIKSFILSGEPVGFLGIGTDTIHKNISLFPTLELFSRNLFKSFRDAEKLHLKTLYVENLPLEGLGRGIMNRIVKAANHDKTLGTSGEMGTHLRPGRIVG